MSVKLLSTFIRTLRQNLPRHSTGCTGTQFWFSTAINMATVEGDEKSEIVVNKNNTRFRKRGKRQWDDPDPRVKENGESESKKPCERIKRKKMAMLLGYCGVDYYGMQRNPGVPTIEEDLLKALLEAKYITEDDFVNQQNAQFQRSSRTDKGVSAARQVVSLKLPLEANIEDINKHLPPCIKVFGIKRVTNKFNSKSKCNARTYSYTLPTYIFDPSLSDEGRKEYRMSPETLQKVNDVLGVYKGTKSYHNFTEKKHFQDPSSLRYMMSFNVERVFVRSDFEFAVLLVKGQSFMLHQIRKMIGLMIAVLRGQTDMTMMQRVFAKDKVMIPTAPGLGLVLDKVHYERYDAKFSASHDSLSWDEVEESIQQFKDDHIYPVIIKGEVEGNMAMWLEKLARHSFEPSDEAMDKETGEIVTAGDDDDDDDGADDESKSDVKPETSDVCESDDVKCQDDDIKCQNDNGKCQNDNGKCQDDEFKCQDDDVKCQSDTKKEENQNVKDSSSN